MEVITIESEAYKEILANIEEIKNELKAKNPKIPFSEKLYDNDEFCQTLKISKRTSQNYRDKGIIGYTQIGSKIYYRQSDIESFLQKHYKSRQEK